MKTANETIEHTRPGFSLRPLLAWFIVVAASVALTAQWAQAAPGGGGGKLPGPWVKLIGKVTNSYTGQGIAGATITLTATGVTINMVTDANGDYSNPKVPVGAFTMTTSFPPNYPNVVKQVSLLKGKSTVNVAMTPSARVIVSASVSGSAVPGGSLTANGSYVVMDGSTVTGSGWTQGAEGVPATIGGGDSATVDLENVDTYLAHLIQILKEPPVSAADLPPDLVLTPITEGEARGGLQDRNQVVAINPKAMEEGEALPLKYTVNTTSGSYSKTVSVVVALPWHVNSGVRTVPVSTTVLLYAKENGGYSWNINSAPAGSTAALTNPLTQTPWFTPDKAGTYLVTETVSSKTIEVHAGGYHGVIDPVLTLDSVQNGDGRPVGDESCTGCHMVGGAAPPNFDTWRNTGHAEAFTQGITTNTHFGENCFACHAVGFGTASGIDATFNYDAFMNLLLTKQAEANATSPADLTKIAPMWVDMLDQMPDTARKSNIQCENCHGPQDFAQSHHTPDSNPDGTTGTPRINLGSEACGSCHGEPARHGRYQQWQLSNHADYDLARSRGASSGNCARCHSGNGFIAWSELDFDPAQQVAVTWNQDTVVPQTCAACHNPHDTGTTSGSDETNARVRVNGNGGTCGDKNCSTYELLAGFTATNVGKGATCMTCHNSRAEVPRNDTTWASLTDSQRTGRPHHGVQADLIMGQNMYFTGGPVRGKHSLIDDTCVTCHMNKTQPPDILSYNQQGTNHTFAADPKICATNCHGTPQSPATDPNANSIDAIITTDMANLKTALSAAYKRMMVNHYPLAIGSTCGNADGTTVTVTDVVWDNRADRLDITLSNGNTCDNRNPNAITVDVGEAGQKTLYALSLASNDGATLKASWNWNMMNEDETILGCPGEGEPGYDPNCTPPHTHRGIHNPSFCISALELATQAVQQVEP